MAAELTKGVVIDISGNTVKLTKAIRDARQEFVTLGSEAKDMEKAMETEFYKSADMVEVLNKRVLESENAWVKLKGAYEQSADQIKDNLDPRLVKLAAEMTKMDEETKKAKEALQQYLMGAADLPKTIKAFEDCAKKAKMLDDALNSGVFTKKDAMAVLDQEIKAGTKALEGMKQQYEQLKDAGVDPTDASMVKLAANMGKTRQKVDDATQAFNKLKDGTYRTRKEQEEFEKQQQEQQAVIDGTKDKLNAWTIALGHLIERGIRRAVQALKQFATAVYESGTAFEYSMASLEALYGTALEAGQIDELAGYFRELGTQSAYSATEIADAATALALAGYSLDETKAAIEPILQLTQATGENFEDMANIVVDGLHEFGMEANEASRFADVLAKTAISTNTDVQEMGEALKYAGAVAGSFGFQIEDLATALGAMATQGVKGSMAGTALRTTITRLATNVSDARTAFESIGGAFYDAEGNARSFYDIVSDLRKGMKGLSDEQRSTLLYTIGGQRAITGLSAILNMAEEDFEHLRDAVADSNGVVSEISKQKLDNLSGDAKILTNNFEEMKMQLFDEVQPALRAVTQSLTNLLQDSHFQKKIKEIGETVRDVIEWGLDHVPQAIELAKTLLGTLAGVYGGKLAVKAITKLDGIVKSFGTFIKAIKLATSAFTTFMGALSPATLVLGGVALAIGACVLSVNDANEAFKTFDPTASKLKNTQKDLAKSIQETTDKTQEEVNTIFDERRDIGLLLSELDKYVDANGNVKKSYEDRVDMILGKLSDATGVEYELIDGTISHYQDLKRTIKEAADEQARQALMATFMDQYTESLKQQAEAQQGFNDALMEQNDYWSKMAQTYKQNGESYTEVWDKAGISFQQFVAMSETDQIKFMKSNEAFQTNISKSYEDTVNTAKDNLLTAQGNYFSALDNLNKAEQGSLADLYRMAAEGTSTVDQSMMSSAAMMQAYLDSYNEMMTQYTEASKAGNTEAAVQFAQAADDMRAKADQLAKDMSSDDAKFYIAFNEGETAKQAYLAVQTVKETVDTAAATEMPATGQNVDAGIGSGMTEGATTLNNTADDVAKGVDEIIGDTLNEENGSEHGTEYVVDGIQTSIETGTPGVVTASETLATESDSAVSGTLTYTGGGSILSNWIQGMIDKLRERMGDVTALAAELGTKTNSALQTTTQVHSPSKFTQWIAEEQINGLVDTYHAKAAEVADSMARLGAVANQSLTASVQNNVSTRDIADSVSSAVTDSLGKLALDGNVNVNVYLEGDAKGMFKVVRTEANNFTRNKGYSPFKKR